MMIDDDGIEIRENSFCAVEGLLEAENSRSVSDDDEDSVEPYEYDKKAPSKVLDVGAVFGHEEVKNGHIFMDDYVADSA